MMMGAALVMGACVFGGLTAVVLMAVGQRTGAGIVAILAGVCVLAGIFVQAGAIKKLNAGKQKSGKPK